MTRFITLLTILWLAHSPTAFAGSTAKTVNKHSPEQITQFAKSVEKFAASQGARAFIIARQGRAADELPKGVEFTHTAIAIYSQISLDNGETAFGYAIHNLYQLDDKPHRSQLVTDYPVDFFWGAHELKAGIIIPNEQMQERIIALYEQDKASQLHNPAYSVVASPYNNEKQNCTEYTLNIINAAIYQTTDMNQLKANASAHFDAQKVNTSPFKLAIGSMFMKEVTTSDHRGKVKTATFTTLGNYMKKFDLAEQVITFAG